VESDINDVKLPIKLDIIFSNAVLHWVHDHMQVFQHFWSMINCNGDRRGQLLIQCGGYGNLRRVYALLRQVMKTNEFKIYFTKMNRPWYFAKPDDTTRLLKEIGYINTRVSLHNDCVSLTDRKIYARFIKTVIMKPFLEHLPVEKRSNNSMGPQTIWSLDYVRLNIIADKP
jgi:trans-aconitate 2-methyltransferase